MTCRVGAAHVPQPAHEQGDVGALAASVGVQLVQDQEAQALGCPDEVLALVRPGQDQFEHDVVGEQDVRRVGQDLTAGVLVLLTGVAGEGHRLLLWGVAEPQELGQFQGL